MNILKKLGGLLGNSKTKKRSKTSIKLDRMYTSQQPWEKSYSKKRKTTKKHPRSK